MTHKEMLLTVGIIAFGTLLTRFLMFFIFPPNKKPPHFVTYLGTVLPSAAISLLVVYALKDIELTSRPFALPEIIAIIVVVFLHKWQRNSLLSIASGTVVYMSLIQFVF